MATALPQAAYRLALAALPWATPRHLAALLERWSPPEAWARVLAGDPALRTTLAGRWQAAARRIDVAAVWAAHHAAGTRVLEPTGAGYPDALADDQEPPAVLLAQGDLAALGDPAVAIVGTRRCTHYGREVARELGHGLAAAGVRIISGLALGIDGAAHAGALLAGAAPPVGVVACGLDVVYPRRHAELWRRVREAGVLLSEAPLGVRPEAWRFPARNRIIAALAQVVVVVESHAAGGSMHTVDAAVARDRPVMAVPGPVRSPASAGTNRLLAEGATPATDVTDVLVALGLEGSRHPAPAGRVECRPPPDADGQAVLEAIGWEPATLEQVAARVGSPLGPVAVQLDRLERAGWVVQRGGWWERQAGR